MYTAPQIYTQPQRKGIWTQLYCRKLKLIVSSRLRWSGLHQVHVVSPHQDLEVRLSEYLRLNTH